jgi:hypothetical protein
MQIATAGQDTYIYTAIDEQGSAVYSFQIDSAGKYVMEARVNSNSDAGHNSFYLGLDNEPAQGRSTYTFDSLVTSGFSWDNVSKRGTGIVNAEFDPMVWDLTAGIHTFTFYGREANTWLDMIILKKQCITQSDLLQNIQQWKAGSITLSQLMEAIRLWKQGC